MNISRRDFIKWVATSATILGLGSWENERIQYALASIERTPVIWLQGAGCSGCTVSLLNMIENSFGGPRPLPRVEKLLEEVDYHTTLMVASATEALNRLGTISASNAPFVLVVEGAIPTAVNGMYCVIGEKSGQPWTARDAVLELGAKARHIIAVGTCASFRGVPGAGVNLTGTTPVDQLTTNTSFNGKIYNLPGCPVHPYIIGETLVRLLAGETLAKDSLKRPTGLYNTKNLHGDNNCPLKGRTKTSQLGVTGFCFENMGCKGKESETKMSCYTRYWGGNANVGCFGAGNMCIGCSSSNFPFTKIYS